MTDEEFIESPFIQMLLEWGMEIIMEGPKDEAAIIPITTEQTAQAQ